MDFTHCPCSGKTLARLVRPAILMVLAQESFHGYQLLKRLAPLSLFQGQAPDATGVYRALREMEQEGLLAGDWDLAARGPAKRRYAITPEGSACLARWVDTLADYQASIAQLLGLARLALGPLDARKAS
jgi:DNA-binding PadR family transcriptional regulator